MACGAWINFSPKEFALPPFGKKTIAYTINVPKDARGGYYGVLFFEKDAEEMSGKKGLNVVTRVGSLFFLETQDRSKMATLENVTMTLHTVRGSFTNKGNVILIPDGIFYILDEQGLVVDRGEAEKIYLPPAETAEYSMSFSPELPVGRYTMVMTMDLEDGDVMVKEIDFEKMSSAELRVLKTRD
ncbi:MAG TPA: hypothetical protein DD723_00395 [Candidatus Omnitrophica bacterium]|nr:hypothetical protein [Candidatus Omnitrophota bacterium]